MALLTLPITWWIVGGIVAATLIWWKRDRRLSTIDGPRGMFLSLPPRATHVFRAWAQQYGELFKIRMGGYNWVVVNSPQAMKEIFDKQVIFPLDEALYQNRLANTTFEKSISTSSKMPAPIGDNVVTGGMRMFTMYDSPFPRN
jgi:hypothetical protein